jgi:putative transposase
MAHLRFDKGTRFLYQEQVYYVEEKLLDGYIRVSNQSYGGERRFKELNLVQAWGKNELKFEVPASRAKPDPKRPILTEFAIADFQALGEKKQKIAWQRYELILPMLRIPREQRTRRMIEEYSSSMRPNYESDATAPKRRKKSRLGEAISRGSIERFLHAFEETGGDPRSLVWDPEDTQGGTGNKRLDPALEEIITSVLDWCKKHPGYRTTKDIFLKVVYRIEEYNLSRNPTESHLEYPDPSTIYQRILEDGSPLIKRRRPTRFEAQAQAPTKRRELPAHIMDELEEDGTTLDLIVVDIDDGLPIGRPNLVRTLCRKSKMIHGMYLGFEKSSYISSKSCLVHGILPKPDTRELYGTTHTWDVYGVPKKIRTDHGREYLQDFSMSCLALGIEHDPTPYIKAPWQNGSIERVNETFNTSLIHPQPGTTFSNVLELGDLDPQKYACISLTVLWQILTIHTVDFYAYDWHEGIEDIPARVWEEDVANGFGPTLHYTADEVRLFLYRSDIKTIGRDGIAFETLQYQNSALMALRTKLLSNRTRLVGPSEDKGRDTTRVWIRYDPEDILFIWVLDPFTNEWIAVEAPDPTYAKGLSIYKHRLIRKNTVLIKKRLVDYAALAATKALIAEIVAEEWSRNRQLRSRTRAARVKGITVEKPHGDPLAPPMLTTPPSIPPSILLLPPQEQELSNWGGDYGLPPLASSNQIKDQ